MTDANSRQVALQNLREFQEMSYADVYALIRQKRFEEAKTKYVSVLENMGVKEFNAALSLNITTPHDNLLSCMSGMAEKVSDPEKIRAVGFDLSAHVIYNDNNGRLTQGIEVSLYSEEAFDFLNASDALITLQCESAASEWQGAFLDIESCALDGLGALAQQFADHAQKHNNLQGIIINENGGAIVDPVAISRHVAKLLLAIEYHRYMAEFVAEVEVPSEMVFIIGEHDEIEVPIVFYRVGKAQLETQPDLSTVAPAQEHQKLTPEETPELYHEDTSISELEIDQAKPKITEVGAKLYQKAQEDQAKIESLASKAYEEKIHETDDFLETTQASYETIDHVEAENEAVPFTHHSLGKPLETRTFGQLTNKAMDNLAEQD